VQRYCSLYNISPFLSCHRIYSLFLPQRNCFPVPSHHISPVHGKQRSPPPPDDPVDLFLFLTLSPPLSFLLPFQIPLGLRFLHYEPFLITYSSPPLPSTPASLQGGRVSGALHEVPAISTISVCRSPLYFFSRRVYSVPFP